jgi:hypothetical protein
MHYFYLFARLYPFFAIPLTFVFFELGIFYRRKESILQNYFWGASGFFGFTFLLWIIFRGDLNSDLWIKNVTHLFQWPLR